MAPLPDLVDERDHLFDSVEAVRLCDLDHRLVVVGLDPVEVDPVEARFRDLGDDPLHELSPFVVPERHGVVAFPAVGVGGDDPLGITDLPVVLPVVPVLLGLADIDVSQDELLVTGVPRARPELIGDVSGVGVFQALGIERVDHEEIDRKVGQIVVGHLVQPLDLIGPRLDLGECISPGPVFRRRVR